MPDAHVKVAITGAAGQIGYALVFRIASGEMFGPDTSVDLQLLELEAALPALEGVAMELDDCAFPLLKRIVRTSDANQAFAGANWALLVGAVPRKAGMERKDLLTVNGGIFTGQGRAIAQNAADDVRVLVVGNPCNTNCLIAAANAPEIPDDRWFAMTMLDENRGRSQLAQRAGVDVTAVRDLAVWGNHSSTQFPDFYHATIGGRPAPEVIGDEGWLQGDFIGAVQQRGAAIIAARGQSSAASAAQCGDRHGAQRQPAHRRDLQRGRPHAGGRIGLWHSAGAGVRISPAGNGTRPGGDRAGHPARRLGAVHDRRHPRRAPRGT